MSKLRRVVLVAAIVSTSLVIAPAARACSCGLGDPRNALKNADAAFIGVLVSRGEATPHRAPGGHLVSSSGDVVTWRFRVVESFKGPLGSRVDVRSAVSGVSCGFEVKSGEAIGVFLRRVDGEWRGGLCSQIEPKELRRAAKPLPQPDGRGPLAFLVGGRYGDFRTIGLDGQGRTLHYGSGAGHTGLTSVCPGSRRAVEIVGMDIGPPFPSAFAIRDLSTFEVLREMRITELDAPRDNRSLGVQSVSCRDPTADDVLVFGSKDADVGHRLVSKIVRVGRDRRSVAWEGEAKAAALSANGSDAFIEKTNGDVYSVDIGSGRTRKIGRLPRPGQSLALSPNGRRLLALSATWPEQHLSVVDVRDASVRTVRLHRQREAMWANDDRIVVLGGPHENSHVTNFDAALTRLSSWSGWGGRSNVVVGERLYGLTFGELRTASLDHGRATTLRTFESAPELYGLVGVSGPSRRSDSPWGLAGAALAAVALAIGALALRRRFG